MTDFNIDRTYSLGPNEGSSQKTNNKFIILHETTNVGAADNASYFKNNWSTVQAYVQYVIGDGGKIFQIGADGYESWGAGSYANANSPVQIELARTNDKETFEADYKTFVNFARYKAQSFGIPCALDKGGKDDNGIKTHYWISQNIWGNHIDPVKSYLQPNWGITQEQLATDIANGISDSGSEDTNPSRNVVTIQNGPDTGISGWSLSGEIVAGSNSTLRNGTSWICSGVYIINGLPMYKIATNEYIPKKYTDQAGIITINAIAGITAIDSAGKRITGSTKTFTDYSRWLSTDKSVRFINGKVCFLVATNEYIDSFYTIGGGNK